MTKKKAKRRIYDQPQPAARPHKFTLNAGAPNHYGIVAVCEYCGAVAFHSNHPDHRDPGVPVNDDCPYSPEVIPGDTAEWYHKANVAQARCEELEAAVADKQEVLESQGQTIVGMNDSHAQYVEEQTKRFDTLLAEKEEIQSQFVKASQEWERMLLRFKRLIPRGGYRPTTSHYDEEGNVWKWCESLKQYRRAHHSEVDDRSVWKPISDLPSQWAFDELETEVVYEP